MQERLSLSQSLRTNKDLAMPRSVVKTDRTPLCEGRMASTRSAAASCCTAAAAASACSSLTCIRSFQRSSHGNCKASCCLYVRKPLHRARRLRPPSKLVCDLQRSVSRSKACARSHADLEGLILLCHLSAGPLVRRRRLRSRVSPRGHLEAGCRRRRLGLLRPRL